MYVYGRGVEKNIDKAVELYQYSADKNYPQGWSNLGMCYKCGMGTDVDIVKANECFKKAGELGDAHIFETIEIFGDPKKSFEYDLKKAETATRTHNIKSAKHMKKVLEPKKILRLQKNGASAPRIAVICMRLL